MLLEIHLTEHGRFHFSSRPDMTLDVYRGRKTTNQQNHFSRSDSILHTFLVTPICKMRSMRGDDITQTSVRRHFNVMHLQGSNVVFVL